MQRCTCAGIQKQEGSDQEEKLEKLLAKPAGSLRFDETVSFCAPDA